jgi:hypothetical protein
VKLAKWALYNETPAENGFEGFRDMFAESNKLIYTRDMDRALADLWSIVTHAHGTIIAANMDRWLPADMYFHVAAFSTVWFFSLHVRQTGLCDVDMHCTRFALPLVRGKVRQEPHAISVIFYLTGVLPVDADILRNLFPDAEVEGNELIIYAD